MDDFEVLRDRYEEALDEAEERRREYLEAVRRAGADGKDVQGLAAATGMSESRVSRLIGVRPRSRRWMWRLAVLLVLPLVASVLIGNTPRPTVLGGVIELESEVAAATLAADLRDLPFISEVNYEQQHIARPGRSDYQDTTYDSRVVRVPTGRNAGAVWILGFSTESLNGEGLNVAEETLSSLLATEDAILYSHPIAAPIISFIAIGLIYLTTLGWLIAGVVALVRFVRRRWRIVRVDTVTT